MASIEEIKFHNPYVPLDFSNVPGYPNCLCKHGSTEAIPIFDRHEDTTAKHTVKFREYLIAWDIMDEDVRMTRFVISLDRRNNRDMSDWYHGFPPQGISSLLQLVKAFGKKWDPNIDEEIIETIISTLTTKEPVEITPKEHLAPLNLPNGLKQLPEAFIAGIRDSLYFVKDFMEVVSYFVVQKLRDRVRATETRLGASFRALFGFALSLGTISRRRVYHEALKYERERNGGWLNPLGYSVLTVAAAVEDSKSMEWYWLLALKSRQQGIKKGVSIRTWRWRGYLIQYTTTGEEGPAVVLVHGFGAFWEHYRDNIVCIAKNGYRVYAITLLGFGRSEKPNIVYTELLWAELLRDFFVDVVGEPVHIVGNSFGGYLVSLVARLWPALVKSLVLCNTGGTVVQNYSTVEYLKPNPNSAVSQLGARFLLFYLKAMARRMLKKFYPINPERADEWLLGEILRASYDPNTVVVLESIVGLKLSLPINYLLDSYNKKVLLIQGNKDPLLQSKRTASMLKQQCNTVVIEDVNAGHCPHDEIPDEVNSLIYDWIKQIEAS